MSIVFGLSAPQSCDTGINSYANRTFTGFSQYNFESILNYAFFEARNLAQRTLSLIRIVQQIMLDIKS